MYDFNDKRTHVFRISLWLNHKKDSNPILSNHSFYCKVIFITSVNTFGMILETIIGFSRYELILCLQKHGIVGELRDTGLDHIGEPRKINHLICILTYTLIWKTHLYNYI